MLNFCNFSSTISISTVKNWMCYSKTALRAGNRSVEKEFKAVTIETIKTGYTFPADTGLSCLLWRQLIETVKAQSALKGLVLIACKRPIIWQEKEANRAFLPYRGLLGVGLLWCRFCHFLDDGSNVCWSVQLQLGKAALISFHDSLYSWHEKSKKKKKKFGAHCQYQACSKCKWKMGS